MALAVLRPHHRKSRLLLLAAGLCVLGALANGSVIVLNGGCMPVVGIALDAETLPTSVHQHCVLTAETVLPWLADVWGVPNLVMASLGDALLALAGLGATSWLLIAAGKHLRPLHPATTGW
jgi:hypothetical protein